MTDLAGTHVGRYRIEGLVRHHAVYSVYVATDPDLGRTAWLSIQRWVAGRAIGGSLLRNEATALARLRHPGIAQVYDVGTHEGRYYLVSEHLAGGSLADAYTAKSLRTPAVVRAIVDAADAIGFAHRRGLVHRSLGPTTLHFDAEGRVRVVAFALSTRRSEAEGSAAVAMVARTGYAAPEQFAQDPERIGPASDVWSLGVTLYEGLVGRPPFTSEQIHAMVGGAPVPEVRFPTPPLPEVPPALERACLRCLQADPADRFPDASALADALRATLGSAAGTASRVFVSHSTSDRELVERDVVGFLERNGVPTWYAKADIDSAKEWERTIVKGLESCDWFLLVMSPRSAASEWVRDELAWAFDRRPGRILPVLVEACDPYAFHLRLPRVQHVDFTGGVPEGQRRLLESLLRAGGAPAAVPVVGPAGGG